jgi:hypothetical protein
MQECALHPLQLQERKMSDPRSKAKVPKVKESKAPHQEIAKQQAMKVTVPPPSKVMKVAGRGR